MEMLYTIRKSKVLLKNYNSKEMRIINGLPICILLNKKNPSPEIFSLATDSEPSETE